MRACTTVLEVMRWQPITSAPSAADDDVRIFADATAPPELSEGLEALAYWHDRQRRLPWYRRSARREATRMAAAWEARVAAAAVRSRGIHPLDRGLAAALVARSWGRRAARRWAWRIQTRLLALGGAAVAIYAALELLA